MPTAFIPPANAASIPEIESSNTTHSSFFNPRPSAPFTKTSGSGLEADTTLPSIITSKKEVIIYDYLDVNIPVALVFHYSENWHIAGGLKYYKLLDDASDSPITDIRGSDNQLIAGLGVAYSW